MGGFHKRKYRESYEGDNDQPKKITILQAGGDKHTNTLLSKFCDCETMGRRRTRLPEARMGVGGNEFEPWIEPKNPPPQGLN